MRDCGGTIRISIRYEDHPNCLMTVGVMAYVRDTALEHWAASMATESIDIEQSWGFEVGGGLLRLILDIAHTSHEFGFDVGLGVGCVLPDLGLEICNALLEACHPLLELDLEV